MPITPGPFGTYKDAWGNPHWEPYVSPSQPKSTTGGSSSYGSNDNSNQNSSSDDSGAAAGAFGILAFAAIGIAVLAAGYYIIKGTYIGVLHQLNKKDPIKDNRLKAAAITGTIYTALAAIGAGSYVYVDHLNKTYPELGITVDRSGSISIYKNINNAIYACNNAGQNCIAYGSSYAGSPKALLIAPHAAFDTLIVRPLSIAEIHDENQTSCSHIVDVSPQNMVYCNDGKTFIANAPSVAEEIKRVINSAHIKKGIGIQVTTQNEYPMVLNLAVARPAEESGLQIGDVITGINNTSTKGMDLDSFVNIIRQAEYSSIRFDIDRHGEKKSFNVSASDYLKETFRETTGKILYGINIEYTQAGDHLLVNRVGPDSPAQHAGLKEGDQITAVNSIPVQESYQEGMPSPIFILRNNDISVLNVDFTRDGISYTTTIEKKWAVKYEEEYLTIGSHLSTPSQHPGPQQMLTTPTPTQPDNEAFQTGGNATLQESRAPLNLNFTVTANTLNLRTEPNAQSTSKGTFAKHSCVSITGNVTANFVEVSAITLGGESSVSGYVSQDYLTRQENAETSACHADFTAK